MTLDDMALNKIPDQLDSKFRRGVPRKKRSSDILREEVAKMTEEINRKQKY